jgi:hypothetical protein
MIRDISQTRIEMATRERAGGVTTLITVSTSLNRIKISWPQVFCFYGTQPLQLNYDPRMPSLFILQPLGQTGSAARRMFYGSELENYDMSLWALDVFNHAQFFGPSAVNGETTSPAFGQVVSAAALRLVQVTLKVAF